MIRGLTQAQLDTLQLVAEWQARHRCGPSVRDIVQRVPGLSSTSSANYTLSKLEREGLIERSGSMSRSAHLTPEGERLVRDLQWAREAKA